MYDVRLQSGAVVNRGLNHNFPKDTIQYCFLKLAS